VEADENRIVLQTKANKQMKIGKEEILRISLRSWKKAGLIELGIGAGGGAARGAAGPPVHDSGASLSAQVVGGAAISGLIGLCIGAIVGMEKTIYRHPAAQTEVRK
jgi:hypothetical protein